MKSLVSVGVGSLVLLGGVALFDRDDTLEARQAPSARARLVASTPEARHRAGLPVAPARPPARASHAVLRADASVIAAPDLNAVVKKNCASCHSDQRKMGNLSLQSFDLATVGATSPIIAEKMIGKLRTGMMPPPGRPRPAGDTLLVLTETLERQMDRRYAASPNPGSRAFQRLNRAEYERSIKDLLGLEINAESWLPLDTRSANFDNIADVQTPSATVLDAYMDAASEISRLAVGDPKASVTTSTYKIPRLANQMDLVDGAPRGTRGGGSVTHNFPADGEYVFTVTLHAIPTGQLYGSTAPFDERIEVSVNGERVAMLDVDRGMSQADPNGMEIRTRPIPVRAGENRVTAAFVRTFEGPVNDNIQPIGNPIADTQIGSQAGITIQSHLQTFAVTGPFNATGVSETASRQRVFTCRPTTESEARPCAEKIVNRLGMLAYRRPLTANDTKALLEFYDRESKNGGFEIGVRSALEAMLASPHFFFRVEEVPTAATDGGRAPVSSIDLASRLSFFLWGAPPDSALLSLGRRGLLSDTTVLLAQTKRMLADPRSEALATRFAGQWLRLQDIDKVHPDALQYPNFNEQLASDMRTETETFFYSLLRENKSLMDFFTADYTFVNQNLAKHYDIPGVTGPAFRKVKYADANRVGVLGHGSMLLLTSHANRTSPVLRGKWVMEVLMGSPPPPPPPDVPDLEATAEHTDGKMLTTRERMEQHRASPSCRSCHVFIDPIGLALDNFDVIGQWRIKENGMLLDTRGDYYDGTKISGPRELQQVLLKRPIPLVRTFTQNLMSYALGRRVEYYDNPAVRKIEVAARANNYRMQDFVLGVVKSDQFRMRLVPVAQAEAPVRGTTRGSSR